MTESQSARSTAASVLLIGLLIGLPACQQRPGNNPAAVQQLLADHAPPSYYDERFSAVPAEELAGLAIPEPQPYRLGKDDVIRVQAVGTDVSPSYATGIEARVKEDGTVRLPQVGRFEAVGLTALELEDLITPQFEEKVVRDAVINVEVLKFEARTFFVVGQVENPGRLPANGKTTVLEALLDVGGTNQETADLDEAYVIRNHAPIPISIRDIVMRGHLAGRMVMEEHDILFVPHVKDRSDFVYVFGEVGTPRRVPMEHEGPRGSEGSLTLAAALADAGGLNPRADINSVTVYRGGWQCPKQFRITRDDMYRHGEDIHLRPGDRIAVGTSDSAQFTDAIGPGVQVLTASGAALSLALSIIALNN